MPEDFVSLNAEIGAGLIKKVLENKKSVCLVMCGRSMEPFLKEGDRLYISSCRLQDYKPADIIAFQTDATDAGIIIHRMFRKKGDYFFTKGDASLRYDPPVALCRVLGKLVKVNRNNKILYGNKINGRLMLLGSYLMVFWFYRQFKSWVRFWR